MSLDLRVSHTYISLFVTQIWSLVVFCTGNPRVFLALPVPVPVKTRTHQAGTGFLHGSAL